MTDEIEGVLESQPVKWRYLRQFLPVNSDYLGGELDRYGSNGWELVSIIPWGGSLLVIFKRPVLPEATNARRLVQTVADLFDSTEPETPEEIDATLRDAGYDPEQVAARIRAVVDRILAENNPNDRR